MSEPATHRIEVGTLRDRRDPVGESVRDRLREDLGVDVEDVRVVDVYTIHADLSNGDLERVRTELLTDGIIQESALDAPVTSEYDYLIEVGFLPGVTDNVGKSAAEGIADVLSRPIQDGEGVFKSTQYLIRGDVAEDTCDRLAGDLLANGLIERWAVRARDGASAGGGPLLELPIVTDRSDPEVHTIDLDISDDALETLSRVMMLALDLDEMQAIRGYYERADVQEARKERGLPQQPTDIEVETLAQTWSERVGGVGAKCAILVGACVLAVGLLWTAALCTLGSIEALLVAWVGGHHPASALVVELGSGFAPLMSLVMMAALVIIPPAMAIDYRQSGYMADWPYGDA